MNGMLKSLMVLAVLPLQGADPAWKADVAAWKAQRHANLMREDGWLTLVGLHWLKEGDNAFGADPALPVVLRAPGLPARAGVLTVAGPEVRLKVAPGALITLKGVPLAGEMKVATDAEGAPDVFQLQGLAFQVIKRGDRFAVRVKDPQSPLRLGFKGMPTYAPDPAYRVVGTFHPHDQPKEIPIPTIVGYTERSLSPGTVTFRLKGREYTLEPVVEDPKEPQLFFIFKDATNGKGSYPAGRFLYAEMPKDGRVVLDFNKAQNPPCAFTPYATCPLPPRQNWLKAAVRAGEKAVEHP